MKLKGYIGIVAVICVLVGILFVISKSPDSETPTSPPPPPQLTIDFKKLPSQWPTILSVAASAPLGNPNAPYTLIECGDFQCPNCGKAAPVIADLIRKSNGQAKLYFVNYPIPTIHPHATEAAEAGLAAASQGKFWPMYDTLYSHQDELIPSEIQFNAKFIPGLDIKKMMADITSHKFMPSISHSLAVLNTAGITSTPSVFFRKGNGEISFFQGTTGDKNAPGIFKLAVNAPWLTPEQRVQEQAVVSAANQMKIPGEED